MNVARASESPGPRARPAAALLIVATLLAFAWYLAGLPATGRELSFSLLAGGAFGIVLQRARFCFFCMFRDWFEARDPRGLLGVLAALAVGLIGYHAVFGAFVPDPSTGRLPPGAHIGPVSWVLAAAAFVFGIGMAVSGSCISAHLYRLGEGALGSLAALLGVIGGFVAGFWLWNGAYLGALQQAPVLWLPGLLGYGGSLLVQLGLMALLAFAVAHGRAIGHPPAGNLSQSLWVGRWPAWSGGLLIGMLGTLAYLRVEPLGVTAELGSLGRTLGDRAGWLPARLEGLDGFSGCATQVKQALLSTNGVFICALVLAALAAALAAGRFQLDWPGWPAAARNLAGGVLLGLGAMLALGCTVGTLLSGIMAGALSGWVFALFCLLGAWTGWRLRQAASR